MRGQIETLKVKGFNEKIEKGRKRAKRETERLAFFQINITIGFMFLLRVSVIVLSYNFGRHFFLPRN